MFLKGVRPSKNVYVFFVCLILSTIFWFLNAFTNSYETVIAFPIKYNGLPDDKIVLNDLPKNLSLQVKSFGFNLITRKFLSKEDTIVISPSILQERTYGRKELSYFATRSILDKITFQIGEDIQITNIITDTIYFEFNKKITKTIPIIPSIEYTFEKQYQQNGVIEVQPEVVRISGPSCYLDTLQSIYTNHLKLDKISESVFEEVGLKLPGNNRYYEVVPSIVSLHIPVEEYTESSLNIRVNVEDYEDSLRVKIFPSEIRITFTVPFSKYDDLTKDLFKASVNTTDIANRDVAKLKIKITKKPDYITITDIQPERVEYILKK